MVGPVHLQTALQYALCANSEVDDVVVAEEAVKDSGCGFYYPYWISCVGYG
jgi:hypothetical protein